VRQVLRNVRFLDRVMDRATTGLGRLLRSERPRRSALASRLPETCHSALGQLGVSLRYICRDTILMWYLLRLIKVAFQGLRQIGNEA
jgi:hypothetical protein